MSRRNLFIALSLANLCYLRVWSELLTYTRSDTYLMKLPPGPMNYAAVMLNVLLTGFLLLAAAAFLRPRFPRSTEVIFLLFLLVPLNALRAVLSNHFDFLRSALFGVVGTRGIELLAGTLGLVGLLFIVRFRPATVRIATALLAALFPFCIVTFGQALWKIVHYDPSGYASKPSAPPLPAAKRSPRVVWVVADEWDYLLTFVDRPHTLQLPEIDRLRTETVFAEQAYPPGGETPVSMPGYFTGKLVESVQYDGPSELLLRFRGDSLPQPWSKQPSLFLDTRALGFNTALVDWYHPGCRVLSGLTYCDWWEMARQFNSAGHSFADVLRNQTRSLFETTLLSVFGQSLAGHQQAGVYQQILREGMAAANNPEFGLVVIHLPIPHAPHAYDRRTGAFTLKNSPIRGYVDSLALLDRAIAELRRSMESSGEWTRSTVVFTSDHHYRESVALVGKDDVRIPFLLKMASQKEGVVYGQRFNTVLMRSLLSAVFRGELGTPGEVTRWLDTNRTNVPEL